MDMTFSNKTANVALNSFALQLNKNSFGLVPSEALRCSPLAPGQSIETSLRFEVEFYFCLLFMAQPISDTNIPRLGSNGPVQKMDPINSVQVAVKADNLGVFYFACNVPMQALFVEDGSMDKSVSHELWF